MFWSWIFLTALTVIYLDNVLPDQSTVEGSTGVSYVSQIPQNRMSDDRRKKQGPKDQKQHKSAEINHKISPKKSDFISSDTNQAESSGDNNKQMTNNLDLKVRSEKQGSSPADKHHGTCPGEGTRFKAWYVAFHWKTQHIGLETENCGRKDQPCHLMQTVMEKMQKGDTIILTAMERQCNPAGQSNTDTQIQQEAFFALPFSLHFYRDFIQNCTMTKLHLKLISKSNQLHTVTMLNATVVNTHISIQDASLCITHSKFYNSSLNLVSSSHLTVLKILKSFFKLWEMTSIHPQSFLFIHLSGRWRLVFLTNSEFIGDKSLFTSALILSSGSLQECIITTSTFSMLLCGVSCEENISISEIYLNSVQFFQSFQAVNLQQADVNKLFLHNSQFVLLGDHSDLQMFTESPNETSFKPTCGHILAVSSAWVSVVNTTFHDNILLHENCSDGLVSFLHCEVFFKDVLFSQNSVEGSNAHGFLKAKGSVLKIDSSKFIANQGGYLNIISSRLYIFRSLFAENTMLQQVTGCQIELWTTPYAGTCGSIIFASNSQQTITESQFESNYADFGGVIFLTGNTVSEPNHVDVTTAAMSTDMEIESQPSTTASTHFVTGKSELSLSENETDIFFNNLHVTVSEEAYDNDTNLVGKGTNEQTVSTTIDLHSNSTTLIGDTSELLISSLTVKNSHFSNNSAMIGGVLLVFSNAATFIKSSSFENNRLNRKTTLVEMVVMLISTQIPIFHSPPRLS